MKTIKRMDIILKARREREAAEFQKELQKYAQKEVDSWLLNVRNRAIEQRQIAIRHYESIYGPAVHLYLDPDDFLSESLMDHFDKTSIASKLKMQVARKKLNEAFKQTPFYKSMMAAVDKIYKLDKSIQEAVEEAKKDGAIK